MAVVAAARAARDHGFAGQDDRIVVTAGIPFGVSGSTNILRVATANERAIYEGGAED
jgi:pyruvate kinase